MPEQLNEELVLDAAQGAMQAAMAAGAEWADAVASWGHSFSVSFERNTIRETSAKYGGGVGVRAFVRGGMAVASAEGLGADVAREVGEQAAQLARAASPDPDFKRLPDPRPIAQIPQLFDEQIAGMSAASLVEVCREAIERGLAARDGVFLSGTASAGAGVWALASCTGINLARRTASVGMGVSASVWDGDRAAAFFDGVEARRMSDFSWQHIPAEVVERAASLLDERPIATGRYDIILDFRPAYGWLAGLIYRCNAEDVQHERSFMIGKEGEQIAAEMVTVTEDPFIDWGLASTAFDGEGVPKEKRNLIDRGVLTTYLHNCYTAGKAGVQPTGHGARAGFHPTVGIAPSNLLVEPGDKTVDQLIGEVDVGILVVIGAPSPNPVTGQVSETVDGGFLIRRGEVQHPVKGAMLAGHIFDYLSRIDAVSSDYREEPGAVMPAVRIRDVQVSGQ